MWHIILGVFIVISLYYIAVYVNWRKNVYNDIEKIQGPKSYPIIGTLHCFLGANRYQIFKILYDITTKYKPFYRLWNAMIPEIHIMLPEHFEQIMTSSVQIKKGSRYRFMRKWLGDGLLLSYGAKWHQRRKMITPTFHFKILENFMTIFEKNAENLVEHLGEKCDGKPFDLYPYITLCALDIICESAMGVSINAMNDKSSSYPSAIYRSAELVVRRVFTAIEQTKLYPIMKNGKEMDRNLKILHGFTDKVIQDRRKLLNKTSTPTETDDDTDLLITKKRLSFLDLLLNESNNLSNVDIREEVDTFMFEGHDTTTAAMCWTLFLLANHPEIQEKLYEEVKSVLADKRVPSKISDLNEMKYLECCVKESLRLYPSVPIIGRNLVEDIIIDGYRVPKGTDCILHIFDAHRNADVYPNPEQFDPERFLAENSVSRHPYAYVPFSAGPRNCIGQKFAMYEEKALLASVIKSYKVLPVDTVESIKLVFEMVLRPIDGVRIKLEKRND